MGLTRLSVVLWLLALFSLVPVAASGDTLYSSGFLDPGPTISSFGSVIDGHAVTASFTLTTDATLTGVDLWVYDTLDGGSPVFATFDYAVMSASGAPLVSGAGNVTSEVYLYDHREHTGVLDGQYDRYTIFTAFDVGAPLNLGPGTYSLSMAGNTVYEAGGTVARWASATNGTGGAFEIKGILVPEASTQSLLLLGCVFFALRQSQRNQTARSEYGDQRQ